MDKFFVQRVYGKVRSRRRSKVATYGKVKKNSIKMYCSNYVEKGMTRLHLPKDHPNLRQNSFFNFWHLHSCHACSVGLTD